MTFSGAVLLERPTEGRIVFGGGYTEPQSEVEAAVERMHFPGDQEIVPVAFEWAMENPKRFAAILKGARYLGNSANTVALAEAQKHASGPGLGLTEAVTVAGVERRPYLALIGGYGLLLADQGEEALGHHDTPEGRINAELIRAKLGELATHPEELIRLGAIHATSSMEVLTILAEAGVPAVAGYMEDDEFRFRAPSGEIRARFERAGGVVRTLPRRLGRHESLLSDSERILPLMYPHLPWPAAGQ